MKTTLRELSRLVMHPIAFNELATKCGFEFPGDIDRFIFQSYGKAIRKIPPAERPNGLIFFLGPSATSGALAGVPELKTVLLKLRQDISKKIYLVPSDLEGGPSVMHEPTASEKQLMVGGAWDYPQAQYLSRGSGKCVVWATGVGVMVFLAGECYCSSLDVVEEMPSGPPKGFQSLSWDDGAIAFECAQHDLNDTGPIGIWRIPAKLLLLPKPEKVISASFSKFLRFRMAGYLHHEEEAHVEHHGRVDISLTHYNARIDIIEVKWVGCSLVSSKATKTQDEILQAIKFNTSGWVTNYDDDTIEEGAKQLKVYLKTAKYTRGYLIVFDCKPPSGNRKNEYIPVNSDHVSPLDPSSFRIIRACVDPRKASITSKSKQP